MQRLRIPAWVTALIAMGVVGLRVWASGKEIGQGVIAFPLDDAYIHLAIAKNFVLHGVWGVTPWEQVSASSSPAWIFILSAMMLMFGNQVWIPVALNVAAAIGLAFTLDRLLKPYIPALGWRALSLTVLLGFLPLYSFVAIGMEHTFQMFIIALYFGFVLKIFSRDRSFNAKEAALFFGLTAVMVSIRVENAILFPIPFLYVLYKKDFKGVIAFAAGPLIAFGAFAAFMTARGLPIEPNSMAVKRTAIPNGANPIGFLANTAAHNLTSHTELLILFLGLFVLFVIHLAGKGRSASRMLLAVPLLGFVLHSVNGQYGSFFRYEGYLMLFSFLTLAVVLAEQFKVGGLTKGMGLAIAVAAVAALSMMPVRTWTVTSQLPFAMANIGHQQLQIARFFARFYPQRSIMVNDIGAVCYYGEPRLLDSGGLATESVSKAFLRGEYTQEFLEREMTRRGVQVGAIFPSWLRGKPSGEMVFVGDWILTNNVVCADPRVDFFATETAGEAANLIRNLEAYDAELPKDVERHRRRPETLPPTRS